MADIKTLMDEPSRQIKAKVNVVYADPFVDPSTASFSSGEANGSILSQVYDGEKDIANKWISLHENNLGGTFKILPSPGGSKPQVGWWSNVLSDSNGLFDSLDPPWLLTTFTPKNIEIVTFSSDVVAGLIIIDADIWFLDTNSDLIDSMSIVGNTQTSFSQFLTSPIIDCAAMVIRVLKINKPNYTARITEFFDLLEETYEASDLLNITLLEEFSYQQSRIRLGAISSNELTISFSNEDGHFDPTNLNSKIHANLKKNRRVTLFFGAIDSLGVEHWVTKGTFWTTKWNIPEGKLFASMTANDVMEILRTTPFDGSPILEDYTLYALFEYVLQRTKYSFVIDVSLKDIIIPYAWLDQGTIRQALQRLASCQSIYVYCDANNVIRVDKIQLTTDNQSVYAIDNSKNTFSKNYPQAQTDQVNTITTPYQKWVASGVVNLLNSTEVISVPANTEKQVTFKFSNSPCLDVTSFTPTKSALLNVTYDAFHWGVIVYLENNTSSALSLTALSIFGTYLLKEYEGKIQLNNEEAIRENGVISLDMDNHDFFQSYEFSESLAQEMLQLVSNNSYDVSVESRGSIVLAVGDTMTDVDKQLDYVLERQQITWNGALSATLTGRRISTGSNHLVYSDSNWLQYSDGNDLYYIQP